MLVAGLLRRLIRTGTLTLVDHRGRRLELGTPGPTPHVTLRLVDSKVDRWIMLNPQLRFGEAYMDGRVEFEAGSIYDFLELFSLNAGIDGSLPFEWLHSAWNGFLRRLHQANPARRAQRNVAHHYDLSGELYDLFLDADRQYSCAYFRHCDETLEQAQANKKAHIIAKLQLSPGQRVLDIGSGWGGLGLSIARACPDVEVVGVTLSREQHARSNARAEEAGLSHRVQFLLKDYREVEGVFDRIVSVGMFEHVGVPHYREFFETLSDRLTDDGIALLHAIGRMDGPGATNPWIRKYIFPGGYTPALSEVMPQIERARLWITDMEILRLHYASTLRHWRQRFQANRDKAKALYDERFCRMWEFYLAGSEVTFRYRGQMVFQIQMAKEVAAVPLTRDYIYRPEEAEAESRAAE